MPEGRCVGQSDRDPVRDLLFRRQYITGDVSAAYLQGMEDRRPAAVPSRTITTVSTGPDGEQLDLNLVRRMSAPDNPDWSFDTLAVRAGQERSQFNEHSEALYLTSSFVFDNAAQAAARFSGAEPGNVYARFTNPTVTTLQERLAALEGAEACIATATGMAAILATVMALMKAGEHIVASRSIFGATQQLFGNILPRFGVGDQFRRPGHASRLSRRDAPEHPAGVHRDAVQSAHRGLRHRCAGEVAHAGPAPCWWSTTASARRPCSVPELGADLVIHSATKYLDGQGRVLGGAVCGARR
jgi:O-succinylhomoserine sulfhydrylase